MDFIAPSQALNSLVKINAPSGKDSPGKEPLSATGMIISDSGGGRAQILTGFRAFDRLSEEAARSVADRLPADRISADRLTADRILPEAGSADLTERAEEEDNGEIGARNGSALSVANKAGSFFSVKTVTRIAPLLDLLLFQTEGDVTEGGRFPPLRIAEWTKGQEVFLTGAAFPPFKPFSLRRAKRVFNQTIYGLSDSPFSGGFERLDFIVNEPVEFPLKTETVFILNQRGELISVATGGAEQTLFGVPSDKLRRFALPRGAASFHQRRRERLQGENILRFFPKNRFPDGRLQRKQSSAEPLAVFFFEGERNKLLYLDFLQDEDIEKSLLKGRQALFVQAKNGDGRDMFQALHFAGFQFEDFSQFMQSVGIAHPGYIHEKQVRFQRGAALWDPLALLDAVTEETHSSFKKFSGPSFLHDTGPGNIIIFPDVSTGLKPLIKASQRLLSPSAAGAAPDFLFSRRKTRPPSSFTASLAENKAPSNILPFPSRRAGRAAKRDDSKSELMYLESLQAMSLAKSFAESGHPHFQYVFGHIDWTLNHEASAYERLDESAKAGYPPGRFAKGLFFISSGLKTLLILDWKDFAPAKKALSLLTGDLNEAKIFMREFRHRSAVLSSFRFPSFQDWHASGDFLNAAALQDTDFYKAGRLFDGALFFLEEGIRILQDLKESLRHQSASDFLGRFEEFLRVELQAPVRFSSEILDDECEAAFSAYFQSPAIGAKDTSI